MIKRFNKLLLILFLVTTSIICISCSEGIKKINEVHPDVKIYCASIDECLNEVGYIVPGLGDAGDRIFGTK